MQIVEEGKRLKMQIADHFREMIRSGRLKPGERLPALREVADEHSISITPVNTAFHALEKEGLVYRRRGLGTFVGRMPQATPTTLDIGVIFRQPSEWTRSDNYGLRLFQGIQQAIQAGEHRALLVTRSPEQIEAAQLPMQFASHPVHGFVLDERVTDAVVEQIVASGRPAVMVNRGTSVPGAASVFRDNRQAGEEIAGQLLAHGHRVVACIYRDQWNSREFATAFFAAMSRAGAAVPAAHGGEIGADSTGIEAAFARVMSSAPIPTAVSCADDRIASMFYMWAKERGLRIPQDVSVTGVLDLELAQSVLPPLSTFRFDPQKIGKAAVEALIAMGGRPDPSSPQTAIPGEWVERESLVRIG